MNPFSFASGRACSNGIATVATASTISVATAMVAAVMERKAIMLATAVAVTVVLRPISLLRLSLLILFDSTNPGNSLWA